MSADKSFDFESIGLAQVLASNKLRIPAHQRDFAWTKDQVDRLLTDLTAAKNNRLDYFLGTIVTIKGDRSDPLEVVDGQQRLTTTYLILAAIRDHLIQMERGQNIIANLDNALLNIPDRQQGKIPRLKLNTDDAEFFRSLTKTSVNLSELRPTRDSHDLLLEAATIVRMWVKKITAPLDENDVPNALDAWISYIEDEAQVVLLKASNGARAFKMFETLNDRGLKTSQADLVKSYLFGESGDQIGEAQVCWSTMLENLHEIDDDDRSLTFLRHLLIATRKFVRADGVYEVIQSQIHGQAESMSFLNNLRSYSAAYIATYQSESDRWKKHPTKVRRALSVFNRFDLKPVRPLVLALVERFGEKELGKAIEFLANLSVRLVLASQTRTGSNEQAFASAALSVFSKEIKNTKKLKDALSKVNIPNTEFKDVFSKARASNAALARYYLRALEAVHDEEPEPHFIANEDETQITLEHVFPKNPREGTWPNFIDEDRRRYKTRIGNLWLLQKSKNSDVPNDSFDTKKPILEACEYKLTKNIADCCDWGPEQIDVRQDAMALLAVKAWPT